MVRSTNTKDDFVLEPDSHIWPFTLRLHAALPSSPEKTCYHGPYLRYVVRIQLIVSKWYKKNIAIPNENLSVCIDLHNPNRATITRISLTFIQHELLGPVGKEEVVLRKEDLNDIHNFQEEQWHGKHEFRISDKVVLTCSCMPPQWSARKSLAISYELHLEAHVHGLCTNVHFRLPITIST